MLKKIAFVMIRVGDLTEALNFYSDVFGLKPIWQDQDRGQAGLLFEESATQIVFSPVNALPIYHSACFL